MTTSAAETDQALIDRVCGGDLAAFEELMRRHNPRVYRVARAIVGHEWMVEEVMQEAYLSAFSHLSKFERRSRFSTWLTRIVINEARTQLRRRAPDMTGLEAEMIHAARDRDPEKSAARRELARLIEQAVDGLPESLRLVFMLREVEGLSTSEAADSLQLSEENVRVRLHRARESLRSQLREHVDSVTTEAFPFHRPRCDRVVTAVLQRLRGRQGSPKRP